ncbi:MAG: sulfide/dihydroorotate dehydrogenase-like FAD/NAD-binding protein [Candidatus Margulisbacteria bacterium]|nr:sulfide/dihydroorotate dehydrogenase-like FAD/NAD-binding protein [Candidatus Margulisiibacteriota bacterium]
MYEILRKEKFSETVHLFEVAAPRIAAKAQAGQFVIVRVNKEGERVPLTIADFDQKNGTITLVVLEAGYSTKLMGQFKKGDSFQDVVGPLGHASEIVTGKNILMVGGGLGIAPIFPIARAMHAAGNKVISVIGAKTEKLLFWQNKLRSVSDKLFIATDDGSEGHKGFVTDLVKELIPKEKIDRVVAIGPGVMMYAVSKMVPQDVELIVSLNSLMVDGTGMCGACRVTVDDKTRFTCVDGPEFDGHKVDYEEFLHRSKFYKEEEAHICKIGLKQI